MGKVKTEMKWNGKSTSSCVPIRTYLLPFLLTFTCLSLEELVEVCAFLSARQDLR